MELIKTNIPEIQILCQLINNFEHQSLIIRRLTSFIVFDDLPGWILKSQKYQNYSNNYSDKFNVSIKHIIF
jgi:hypothetical protein